MRAAKYLILVIIFAGYLASFKNQNIAKNAGNTRDRKRDIAAVRYAPRGRYMKDHCFVLKNQKFHLFAPLGTAVAASGREGYFDKTMGGIALRAADMNGATSSGNPAESPFVMKHPQSGKWMIFLNGGHSVSDSPLQFPPIQPYSFKSG
ncbi:MAG: hypothetical protein WC865_01580 [Bacteroidales bacterium]